MKRGFATRRSNIALRFLAATPPLHRSRKASASYRRKPMLHSKLPPCVLKNAENCDIMKPERRWRYEENNKRDVYGLYKGLL